MKNIFKGAKFDDKFVTREGRIAIFNHQYTSFCANLFIEGTGLLRYNLDGTYRVDKKQRYAPEMDIVSKYQKPSINEDELDELAIKYVKNKMPLDYKKSLTDKGYKDFLENVKNDFKAGYRKAIEK